MFNPRIRITLEFAPGEYLEVWRNIETDFFKRTFEPLDIPRPGSDAHTMMLCSDGPTITRVMKDRRTIARLISDAIADDLVKRMGAKDTENGYPKDHPNRQR